MVLLRLGGVCVDFILKKFCLWPLRLRWPNRSALPLPPHGKNPTQNGKQTLVKMARVMLVKMASKSLAEWQAYSLVDVGSVGSANRIAVPASTLRQCWQCWQCQPDRSACVPCSAQMRSCWHCRSCGPFFLRFSVATGSCVNLT